MAQTPEGKVKAKLDKMLKEFEPDLWFFAPQSGIYGRSGVPDRIACYYGRFYGIECKAGNTRQLTDLQVATMQKILGAGGHCWTVVDDATIEDLREHLIAMKTKDRILS